MSVTEKILCFNQEFVKNREYEAYETDKYPNKKIAILSCMDTRLTALLPAALGLKNGDAKMIKNAGGVVNHPFGSVMRSLMVAIYELGVDEILVVGHDDCGMQGLKPQELKQKMQKRGIPSERFELLSQCGINVDEWLKGFDCAEESVRQTVLRIKKHPLMPEGVFVSGFLMDSVTGELRSVKIN